MSKLELLETLRYMMSELKELEAQVKNSLRPKKSRRTSIRRRGTLRLVSNKEAVHQ